MPTDESAPIGHIHCLSFLPFIEKLIYNFTNGLIGTASPDSLNTTGKLLGPHYYYDFMD